jgi:hypothetical protein
MLRSYKSTLFGNNVSTVSRNTFYAVCSTVSLRYETSPYNLYEACNRGCNSLGSLETCIYCCLICLLVIGTVSGLFLCRSRVKWGYLCISYIGSEHINQRLTVSMVNTTTGNPGPPGKTFHPPLYSPASPQHVHLVPSPISRSPRWMVWQESLRFNLFKLKIQAVKRGSSPRDQPEMMMATTKSLQGCDAVRDVERTVIVISQHHCIFI